MRVLIINGPNLNMLGRRDASIYGQTRLSEIVDRVRDRATGLGVEAKFFQSNHEGAIVDYLQENSSESAGVIINAGALTHYGLSLRDALADTGLPIIEVHISNIHARERFRRNSVIAPVAVGQIAGLGPHGYVLALEHLAERLQEGDNE